MKKQPLLQIDEPLLKKQLRAVIQRKKKLLTQLSLTVEETRAELMHIKAEYDRRIGLLHKKLDDLDRDMFELRHLHDLLVKGMAYAQAVRLLEERAQSQAEREAAKEAAASGEQDVRPNRARELQPPERDVLKKLWRKLAFRFHPDLVHDEEEKRFRESMMQRVNDAYARADIVALEVIMNEEVTTEIVLADATMTELEKNLMDTEAGIRRMRQKLKAFKKVAWYEWKKHIETASAKKQDFFATLEKNTQKTIKEKEREIGKLEVAIAKYR